MHKISRWCLGRKKPASVQKKHSLPKYGSLCLSSIPGHYSTYHISSCIAKQRRLYLFQ